MLDQHTGQSTSDSERNGIVTNNKKSMLVAAASQAVDRRNYQTVPGKL